MKQLKSVRGVTLLEIMLVLAIAAMVIVMSIRYYQSATASSQANATLSQIQAIAATMDNLALANGSYENINTSLLTNAMGSRNMRTMTNQLIEVNPQSETTYQVTMQLTPSVCTSVASKLLTNGKFDPGDPVAGCTAGTLEYTYDNTK